MRSTVKCVTSLCLAFSVLFTSSGVAEEMEKTCKDVELCQEYKAQFPELCSSSETWYKTNCPVSCERCSPEAITRNHPSRTRLMTTEKHMYSDTRETTPNTTYIRSAESRDYAGKIEPVPRLIYILLAAAVVVIIVVAVIVVIVRRKQQKRIQRRRQDEIQALYPNIRTKAKVHPIVCSEPGQEVHFEPVSTHKPPNDSTSTDSKHNPRRLSETETPVLTQQCSGPSPLETVIYFSGIPDNNSPITANDSLNATTRSVNKIPIDKPRRQPRTKERSVTDQCSAHGLTPMNRKKHNNYYENVHRSNFVSVDGSHFTLRK